MNKKNRKIALSLAALLAVSFIAGGFYIVSADQPLEEPTNAPSLGGFFGWHPGCILHQLTEEQRTELMESISEMREEGSTREEIREYVKGYLEDNEIYCPWSELSEEEKEAWRQLRSDVREYAESRAEELGIELPPWRGPFFHRVHRVARWRRGFCGFGNGRNNN
ncbi:hypothetical protein GF319_06910 [Candidatus Bathyarchaeota archaeon]|nr:hypothetical protein [Candidatus Bathyarchaeota archaeon]